MMFDNGDRIQIIISKQNKKIVIIYLTQKSKILFLFIIIIKQDMLLCKNIKRMFGSILLFNGRMSFNPATLNNQIHTYFLADEWQRQNTNHHKNNPCLKEKGKEEFTYEQWIDLVQKSHAFRLDYDQAINEIKSKNQNFKGFEFGVNLFNNWSVYGDSVCLPQYKAIARINDETGQVTRFTQENNKFPITYKMGQNKIVIADQDTDAQMVSNMIGFHLIWRNSKITKFLSSSFRNIDGRVVDQVGSAALKANWFFTGKTQLLPSDKTAFINHHQKAFLDQLSQNVFVRKNQFRYNAVTKLSSVLGYVANSQQQANTPIMQGWREILLSEENLSGSMYVKNTNNGLLVDIIHCVFDQSSPSDNSIVYPDQYKLRVYDKDGDFFSKTINLKDIVENQAGVFYIQTQRPLNQNLITASIQVGFGQRKAKLIGVEQEICLAIKNASLKSKLNQTNPITNKQYLNQTQIQLFATSKGIPLNGQVSLRVRSNYQVDAGGIYQYSTNLGSIIGRTIPTIDERIEYVLQNNSNFKDKYISLDNIKQTVYLNKLDLIKNVSNKLVERINFAKTQKVSLQSWKIMKLQNGSQIPTNQTFKMVFKQSQPGSDGKTMIKSFNFQNGFARVKLGLDTPVTAANNPRHPSIQSITLNANITWAKSTNSQAAVPFACIFYQTDLQKSQSPQSDWINDVGPILKTMALLYPSMQKIVNLYNFKGVSMNAMKRAFDIEDQTHVRYMPATRQLSQLAHRKIRKWLYEPFYNKQMTSITSKAFYNLQKKYNFNCNGGSKAFDYAANIDLFKKNKKKLINDLKSAFKVEVTTIPLYLSAMFTAPNQKTKKLIHQIAIDQMKHVFIVSNILNAMEDKSLTGEAQNVPYTTPDFVPKFPTDGLGEILQPQTDKLKDKFNFDIQPCSAEQILNFTCIQLPSQIGNLSFSYNGTANKDRVNKLIQMTDDLKNEFKENPNFKTIGLFYSNLIEQFWRLSDLQDYINLNAGPAQKVKIFSGDPRKQFLYFGLTNMAEVYDLRSTLNQLRLIVEEGEGSNLFTLTGELNKTSHYIRFIELYTQCDISIQSGNPNIAGTNIVFKLTDGPLQTNQSQQLKTLWTTERDQTVKQLINEEFCKQRFSGKFVKQADIYARPSFLNAYEAIMEDFSFIFNSDITSVKQYLMKYQSKTSKDISQADVTRQLQVQRRKRMENAIAKMRQMTIYADRIIHPNWAVPESNSSDGSRPDYNINFDSTRSYSCPSTKSTSTSFSDKTSHSKPKFKEQFGGKPSLDNIEKQKKNKN